MLTSASVHDSQVAIPLLTQTSQRVDYLYDLMDSAYDADLIHAHSRDLNHVPIIAPHPRRGTKKPSPLTKIFPPKPTPELSWAEQDRYKERTMSERVNARLKDEWGKPCAGTWPGEGDGAPHVRRVGSDCRPMA